MYKGPPTPHHLYGLVTGATNTTIDDLMQLKEHLEQDVGDIQEEITLMYQDLSKLETTADLTWGQHDTIPED